MSKEFTGVEQSLRLLTSRINILKKDYRYNDHPDNLLNTALEELHLKPLKKIFHRQKSCSIMSCELYFDNVQLAHVWGQSEKTTETYAYYTALAALKKPESLYSQVVNGNSVTISDQGQPQCAAGDNTLKNDDHVENSSQECKNARKICKMPERYGDIEVNDDVTEQLAALWLSDISDSVSTLPDVLVRNTFIPEKAGSADAISDHSISQNRYASGSVQTKLDDYPSLTFINQNIPDSPNNIPQSHQHRISLDPDIGVNVFREGVIESALGSIPESNIGHKMLRKMGWTGGGLGRRGQGILVPLPIRSNAALGYNKHRKPYVANIKALLKNYKDSSNKNALVFSADFTHEERRMIRQQVKNIRRLEADIFTSHEGYLVVKKK